MSYNTGLADGLQCKNYETLRWFAPRLEAQSLQRALFCCCYCVNICKHSNFIIYMTDVLKFLLVFH